MGIVELIEDGGYLAGIGPKLYREFLSRGILLRPLGNVLYFMPPYVITEAETAQVIGADHRSPAGIGLGWKRNRRPGTRAPPVARMRRYLHLLGQYFSQYAKVRLAYKSDFLVSVATTMVATAFGIALVFILFQRAPEIAGWRFNEILFLYGFGTDPVVAL